MGIDGIGKGKGLPPTSPGAADVHAPKATEGASKPFEVDAKKPAAAAETNAARATGSSALERFRAGEIDGPGYIDAKVDEATAHLKGLTKVELETIRATLRDQMATDPAFVDLIKQATGHTPAVPED
jgi:hypothetical protein